MTQALEPKEKPPIMVWLISTALAPAIAFILFGALSLANVGSSNAVFGFLAALALLSSPMYFIAWTAHHLSSIVSRPSIMRFLVVLVAVTSANAFLMYGGCISSFALGYGF